MAERPILFSAPMVRALLAGTKTQTRRVCKPAGAAALSHVVEVPDPAERGQVYNGSTFGDEDGEVQFSCPYGGRGDKLWVREAFADARAAAAGRVLYRADGDAACRWTPSIHMPRAASRLVLEITEVRVERLQDISEADALAEGITFTDYGRQCGHTGGGWAEVGDCTAPATSHPQRPGWGVEPSSHMQCMHSAPAAYSTLWEQINGAGSWNTNPWVWAVSFKVEQAQGGAS